MDAQPISFEEDDLTDEGHLAKEETRRMALDVVREAPMLWSHEHRALRCGWVELAGPGAPTLATLQAAGALRPDVPGGHFYGVDIDPVALDLARERHPGPVPVTWVNDDIFTLIKRPSRFQDAGVLVYDSFDAARGDETIVPHLYDLARFARRQEKRLGEFLLVLNVVASRCSPEDLAAYRTLVGEAFGIDPIREEATHRYVSRSTAMLWTAIRLGF